MVNRTDKINSLLEHEVGKILLKEFYFPGTMITLTHVDTSANLIEAKVYISTYPEARLEEIVEILNRNVYGIQHQINRLLRMRPIPKIKFVKDKELAKVGKIEELLVKVQEEELKNKKK
jgi:ribosome-binding factor A